MSRLLSTKLFFLNQYLYFPPKKTKHRCRVCVSNILFENTIEILHPGKKNIKERIPNLLNIEFYGL